MSPAVVSFTLNGSRPVAPATAARVRAAIAVLDYTPNAAARALTTGQSTMLGLVVQDLADPFHTRIVATVQEAAAARELTVIVVSTLGDPSRTLRLMQELDDRQVRGIVLSAAISDADAAAAARLRAPIVQIAGFGIASATHVAAEMRLGAESAMRHLVELGHERIAFVGGRDGLHARMGAWEASHAERGVEPGPSAVVPCSRAGGDAGMRRLLAEEVPTAVLCASDMVAVGVLRALRESGLRVPDDVSVVGFDDTHEALWAAPALTTVHVPIAEMARDAVLALDDPTTEGSEIRHPTRLVVRDSTAPPRDVRARARPRRAASR